MADEEQVHLLVDGTPVACLGEILEQPGVFHGGFVKACFEVLAELVVYDVYAADARIREPVYHLLVDVDDVGSFEGIEGAAGGELRVEAYKGLVSLRIHVLELGDHGFEGQARGLLEPAKRLGEVAFPALDRGNSAVVVRLGHDVVIAVGAKRVTER